MGINKIIKRILLDFLALMSIAFLPWWLVIVLLFICAFFFRPYLELPFLVFFVETLYGLNTYFTFTFIALIGLIIIEKLPDYFVFPNMR